MGDQITDAILNAAKGAVMCLGEEMSSDSIPVKGYNFSEGLDYDKLLQAYRHTGLQASSFGLAVEEINRMVCF